ATVVGAADQATLEETVREEAAEEGLGLVVSEGLSGLLVLHELDRPEVAGAAKIPCDRQLEERGQGVAKRTLVGCDLLDEALAAHDLEVRLRDRALDRVAAEGDPVGEGGGLLEEGSGHRVAGDDGADRRVGGGESLGAGDQVRADVVALAREPAAEAA